MKNQFLKQLKNKQKKINIKNTKYPVIPYVAQSLLKWKINNQQNWTIMWNDHAVTIQFVKTLSKYQKINHFPGMHQLSRKNRLAKNLIQMRKQFSVEYDFFPLTWILPNDYNDLVTQAFSYPQKIFIVKPQAGCQGRGIYLTHSVIDLESKSGYIVQQYLLNPYLIDNLKFDFRIYVLITSVNPLRIFVYKQGLVRFATQEFTQPNHENIKNNFTHLTNYAINKESSKFTSDQSDFSKGHKRSLTSILKYIKSDTLLNQIYDVIIKTIISGYPQLCNQYKLSQPINSECCFQLLGFDIILTQQLKPILLEVNHTPSFNTDTQLDKQVKTNLIYDTLNIIQGSEIIIQDQELSRSRKPEDRLVYFQEKIKAKDFHQNYNKGNYTKIYPCKTLEQTQDYDAFFSYSQNCFQKKYGTNIIRSKRKVNMTINKQQEHNIFIPKLNLHRDLYKVYNNSSLKPIVKKDDREKKEKSNRYDQNYNIRNDQSFRQSLFTNIYGKRGISTAGRSTNYY